MKFADLLKPEVIGDKECPILHRWTIWPPFGGFDIAHSRGSGSGGVTPDWMPKLLLHHFMPQADERHFHDHPRGFLTIVLRGGYDDLGPCEPCDGTGQFIGGGFDYAYGEDQPPITYSTVEQCTPCGGTGAKMQDYMRAGSIRWRSARHTHRTRVHEGGCWTVVLMGPMVREWGFRVGIRWLPWREYKAKFGSGMRCA